METTVWVGKVKSTIAPTLLAEAFSEVGPIAKVETGFGGFAFVEFESADDAKKAVETLHRKTLPKIGEVAVDNCTYKGYMGAIDRRDNYWRNKGKHGPHADHTLNLKAGADRSRSTSRRRRRSFSRSRSDSRECRRNRRSRSFSRSRSHSRSRARSKSWTPSRPRSPHQATACAGENDVGYNGDSTIAPCDDSGVAQGIGDQANTRTHNGSEGAHLSRGDRTATVRFFDGSCAAKLLIEGAELVRLPDDFVQVLMKGFPRGFEGLSEEDVTQLLDMLAGFIRGVNEAGQELSAEVRQTLVLDARGKRILRKSIVINGRVRFSEKQML
mmetsp:Transcript_95571/g.270400  ORF Transcript_95571/g.270400 Transcript_95571/m.270400 type:complete len:327 (+) Transcript_95571:159-1139(+)